MAFLSHGRQLEVSCFLFNLSSRCLIYIVKYHFTGGDDNFVSMAETTFLACKIFTSGFRSWLKNGACLSSLVFFHGCFLLFQGIAFVV